MPQVSIVLPIRNAAGTLRECMESIFSQTLQDFEIVAVDDGSEDDSCRILSDFQDPRIRLFQWGRIGLVAALNRGVEHSQSEFIARMDSDDIMHSNRLQAQHDFLLQNPQVSVVSCQVELFPAREIQAGYREYVRWQNSCLKPEDISANIYVESPHAHPSVMFRKSAFQKMGGYEEGPFPEDYELWLRMHHSGYFMAKIPDILLRWRERHDRASRTELRYSNSAFAELRARYLALDERVNNAANIVVWGAGFKTRKRTRLLLKHGIQFSAWVDIDPEKIGQTLWDRPIYPAGWLKDLSPRPLVLIYVTNHGARELIGQTLDGMGYRKGRDYLAIG